MEEYNKTNKHNTSPLKPKVIPLKKPKVVTHISFWVPLYCKALYFIAMLMDTEVDEDKKRKIIAKGIRWERVQ
jgi:hypothetical protein